MSQNKAYIVRGPHAWGMADKRTTAIKKARANLPRKGSAYYTKKGRPVLLQVLEHDRDAPWTISTFDGSLHCEVNDTSIKLVDAVLVDANGAKPAAACPSCGHMGFNTSVMFGDSPRQTAYTCGCING